MECGRKKSAFFCADVLHYQNNLYICVTVPTTGRVNNLNNNKMDKYYLRNQLVWNQLDEEQLKELTDNGTVTINDITYSQAPRLTCFNNNKGFVEMYEISDTNVLFGLILSGVSVPTGDVAVASGINNITIPLNTVYYVRTIVSTVERYPNNRFFTDIVDAIEYYNTLETFIKNK